MSWKVRHEGSPQAVEGLNLEQIVEGLREGQWEPTDEVQAPGETRWTAMENHPQLAELAAEIEPAQPTHRHEETHLDMNPLIDVCLVLLVFFILTTTYESIRKVLEMPASKTSSGVKSVTKEKVDQLMIRLKAFKQDGKTVILVQDQPVEIDQLLIVLTRYVSDTKKTELLIDAKDIDWGTLITIQDAAKEAGFHKGHYLRPKTPKKQ
jgi:biopolymer transport protein ExbD